MRQGKPPDDTPQRDEITDEMLLYAIKNGATWAIEPLYQRYGRFLYSVILHMVFDVQMAEDLLQETFILVWRRASYYSPKLGIVRNWLTAIARNRTIDYLRHQKIQPPMSTLDAVDLDPSAAHPDTMDEALNSLQAEQVRRALMSLPIEQRMIIELAFFQGWTQSEIASERNIALGTVKSRMRAGMATLRMILIRAEISNP